MLCRRVVKCLGCLQPPPEPETLGEAMMQPNAALSRMVLGALPRGKKAKPLVQEFGSYVALFAEAGDTHAADRFLLTLPKSARETSRRKVTGEEVRGARGKSSDGDFASVKFDDKFDDKLVDVALKGEDVFDKIFFGIPSSPEDFIARALKAGHPRSLQIE